MNDDIDYNALNWVRHELDEVLRQACTSLGEYAGNRDNSACLQECAINLHEARGPLRMVGLKGADQLASEMEEVIADLQIGNLQQPDAVLEALLQAFLQLPGYLSRLHPGRTDNPVALLPLINSLRGVRDIPLLDERAVFAPDLGAPLPEAVYTARMSVSERKIHTRALAARSRFEAGLLEWYRGGEGNTGLQAVHDVLVKMQQDAGRACVARLWWAAACMAASMIEGEIAETTETRQIFSQLDRQIKRLADAGEAVFEDPLTDGLLKRLLYCIAHTESSLACMQLIKTTYKLQDIAADGDAADNSPAAGNDELLQAVAHTLTEDIQRIKERLDVFMRATRRNPQDLLTVADELHTLGKMLDSVGSKDRGADALNQAQLVRAMAAGETVIDETALMDVAILLLAAGDAVHQHGAVGAVAEDSCADSQVPGQGMQALAGEVPGDDIRIEAATAEFIKPPQADPLQQDLDETCVPAAAAHDEAAGSLEAAFVTGLQEIDADADEEIVAIFMEEAGEVLQQLGGHLPAWFADPDNRHALLEARRGFHTIKGSGRMVGALAVGEFAWAFENLLNRIIEGAVEPGEQLLELLGQALPALGQLLARVTDSDAVLQADVDAMVQAAAMFSQGVMQPPGITAEALPASAAGVPSRVSADEAVEELTPGDDALESCARVEAPPETCGNQPADDPFAAMDSELLEVFIEEASELIDAGENTLRAWSKQPDSQELMAEFQRQLHTLKGGARMVDITPIGDLSHTLESLLTRVVDGQIEIDDRLFLLLHDSHDHLAEMLEHVKARQLPADAGKLQTVIGDLGPGSVCVGDAGSIDQAAGKETFATQADQQCQVTANETAPAVDSGGRQDDEDVAHGDPAGLTVAPQAMQGVEPGTAAVTGIVAGPSAGTPAEPPMETRAEPVFDAEAASAIAPAAEAAPEPAAAPAPGVQAETPADTDSAQPVPAAVERQEPELLPQPVERRKQPRVRSEQVRVRSDLLDNMVNHAAEINIYRARMEQQISDYRHNLGELDQTIGRLRGQLRQVEMETEAHILFRHEQQGESAGHDFDPLEMDRYSKLQQLSRSLLESVGDLRSLQGLMENTTRESESLFLQQSRVSADLQEGLLHSRMIPFAGLAPRLRRVLRQSAKALGKEVNLNLEGADGEMDRTIIDRIVSPLEHMLRNAVAHGIEEPAIRKQLGKARAGTLKISFDREGPEIVMRIEDDGAGLDIEAIRRRAIERKLLDADADIPDSDIMQFVLQSGFSTAVEVTQIAGRGVGMDVVNDEVRQLGGSLHISSVAGEGTTFTIRLPYTLAVNQALLVKAGKETLCIPLIGIEGIARISPQQLAGCYQAEDGMLEYADNHYRLQHLGSLLGCGGMEQGMKQGRVPVLLTRPGDNRVAFQLESIIGSREIVIKPLGAQLGGVNGISGATILGDGRVALILDIMSLSRMQGQVAAPLMTDAGAGGERLQVMVVDDSITVRKVTRRLLERNGFEVHTAKDGVDALGQLRENIPDIMLLDIEMPRMDGFELATHMRNDGRLKHVPIIMITSRSGDKHRRHAKKIGVNKFLGKPYQESELLDSIQGLIDVDGREACA